MKKSTTKVALTVAIRSATTGLKAPRLMKAAFTVMAVSTSNPMPRAIEKAREVKCSCSDMCVLKSGG